MWAHTREAACRNLLGNFIPVAFQRSSECSHRIFKCVAHVVAATLHVDEGVHLQRFAVRQGHAFLVMAI